MLNYADFKLRSNFSAKIFLRDKGSSGGGGNC